MAKLINKKRVSEAVKKAGVKSAAIGAAGLAASQESEASMIGQSAKTFNKAALEYAEQLEKQGAPMEAIRRMTGYQFGTPIHRGVDGKWRQEISDENARLLKSGAGDLSSYGYRKQGAIYENPSLYGAYPDMEKIDVSNMADKGFSGVYYPEDDLIALNPLDVRNAANVRKRSEGDSVSRLEGTLIHENQHAVQEREGFAKGGTPEFLEDEAKSWRDAKWWNGEIKRKRKEYPKEDDAFIENAIVEEYLNMGMPDIIPSPEVRDIAKNINKISNDEKRSKDMLIKALGLDERTSPKGSYEAYRKLAGEEEARQTEKRLGLTMKERIDRDPRLDFDTPPEQQIVIGAKGASSPAYLAGVAGVTAAGTALTTKQKAERARLSRMTRKQQLADVTKRALGVLTEIPGDLAKYAHDVANFGAGIFSTADLLGGAAAIPYEMTGNLEAYQRDVQPYVQQANETQSAGFRKLEDMAGKVIETAITATAPAWYPAYQQWSPIIGNAMEDFYYPNADQYDR